MGRSPSPRQASIAILVIVLLIVLFSRNETPGPATTGLPEPGARSADAAKEPPLAPSPNANEPGEIEGRVVFVADGDSLDVRSNGSTIRVRLWGIDAPEGNTRQPHAREARDFTQRRCKDQRVRIIKHDEDRYGRVVAEIILQDGTNLNRELVAGGFAWHYRRHAPNETGFAQAEKEARIARIGLWKDANPLPPWEWRRVNAPKTE